MNKSIMTKNLLFDIARIRCELVFLNKSKHITQCENIKAILNDLFITVNIKLPIPISDDSNQSSIQNKILFLAYYDREEINYENALILTK